MTVLVEDIDIGKEKLTYNELINFLSKKSVLDKIEVIDIDIEGTEYFDEKTEKKLLGLNSVNSLINAL